MCPRLCSHRQSIFSCVRASCRTRERFFFCLVAFLCFVPGVDEPKITGVRKCFFFFFFLCFVKSKRSRNHCVLSSSFVQARSRAETTVVNIFCCYCCYCCRCCCYVFRAEKSSRQCSGVVCVCVVRAEVEPKLKFFFFLCVFRAEIEPFFFFVCFNPQCLDCCREMYCYILWCCNAAETRRMMKINREFGSSGGFAGCVRVWTGNACCPQEILSPF